MKANQKFLGRRDDAVSPVIAVILMVAITVVLAATVYVWVSGFGGSGGTPAKTVSLSSAGTIQGIDWVDGSDDSWDLDGSDEASDHFRKSYTVSAAATGMRYQDFTLTVNGATLAMFYDSGDPDACEFPDPDVLAHTYQDGNALLWSACAGTTARDAGDVIQAGDRIVIQHHAALSGATLRVLDTQANSVILTLTVG